jgi:hypothetical protein
MLSLPASLLMQLLLLLLLLLLFLLLLLLLLLLILMLQLLLLSLALLLPCSVAADAGKLLHELQRLGLHPVVVLEILK